MMLITCPAAGSVIGCALRVHRALGPGLFESVYEQCLTLEFERDALAFKRQVRFKVEYEGSTLPLAFSADFIVED